MGSTDNDPDSTHILPPISPVERDAVYAATQEAIKSRNMREAHQLLLKMIQVDGGNPELWLLLAWTAPTRREAGVFFEHLLQIQPDYPLAICGVAWSGIEWSLEDNRRSPDELPDPAQTTGSLDARYRGSQKGGTAQPLVARGSKPLMRQTGELTPQAGPVANWSNGPQAEWLQPATWIKENAEADYPFLDDGARGRGETGEHILAILKRISFPTFLTLLILGISSAELVTAFRSHILGLVYYGILLIILFLCSIFSRGSKYHKLLLALSLVPLFRLISLSMPRLGISQFYAYMLIGIVILSAAVLINRLAGFNPKQIGIAWGKSVPLQLLIGLVGLFLGLIEYIILQPGPATDVFSLPAILLPAAALMIFLGFVEELVFRGILQRASSTVYKRIAPILTALLYAILHISYRSWIDLIFLLFIGLLFSYFVAKTHSLFGVTLAHGLANICLFLVFPLVLAAPIKNYLLIPLPLAQINSPAIWSAPTPRRMDIIIPGEVTTPTPTLRDRETATLTYASTIINTTTFTSTIIPTNTATLTISPYRSPTATLTQTAVLQPPRTSTPTPTQANTPTITMIPTPTHTPSPTEPEIPSQTPTSTITIFPTDEWPTSIPTDTPTDTPVPPNSE